MDIREVNAARDERGMRLKFKSPEHAAELIKKTAHLYGASVVGITTMDPEYCLFHDSGYGSSDGGPIRNTQNLKVPMLLQVLGLVQHRKADATDG